MTERREFCRYTMAAVVGAGIMAPARFDVRTALENGPSSGSGLAGLHDARDFGAHGDGKNDDARAIEACLAAAVADGGIVYLSPGTYAVSRPVVAPRNSQTFAVVGSPSGWQYNDGTGAATIVTIGTSWAADAAVLDFATTRGVLFRNLTIDGRGQPVTCLRLGASGSGGRAFAGHELENCSLFNGKRGLHAVNSGVLRVSHCQFAHQKMAGCHLDATGDSDFEGCYFNTNNPDAASNDQFTGSGLLIANGSSNLNIRGGKVEWNAKGIQIHDSSGITVTGVNFDVNRAAHVLVISSGGGPHSNRSVVITGCRFLAGGTYVNGAGTWGGGSLCVWAQNGGSADVTVSGSSFRRGGDAAYDLNQGHNLGPVHAICARAAALGRVTVLAAGCDLQEGSTGTPVLTSGGAVVNATTSRVGAG